MKRVSGIKGIVVVFIMALLIVGYYYYLSNRSVPQNEEDSSQEHILTAAEEVLTRNLDTNYPPTPREVVKYFSEITQCFYNEENTDEDINALGLKIRELYDDDLIANQSEADYLESLKFDIEDYKSKNRTIFNYTPSSSVDVEKFTKDGYECARLYCNYAIKQGELIYNSNIVFILRKDKNSHYKIMGWDLVKENDSNP